MKKYFGPTPVKSLTALSAMALLFTLSMPASSNIAKYSEARDETNSLLSLLTRARNESIKKSQVVTLCKSADRNECGGHWRDGWLLFVDNNKDGKHDTSEEIITSGQSEQGFKLSYRAVSSSNHLRFVPTGSTLSQNGSFKLCPADNDPRYARVVIITETKTIRLTRDTDNDGIYEDVSGEPLTCP